MKAIASWKYLRNYLLITSMNGERLKIIDNLLRAGWQSYYDFAKAIYCKPEHVYLYDGDFKAIRSSIVQDFRIIQDIWYCAHHGELIPKGNSTSDKSPLRAGLIAEIFESKTQKQFAAERVPELFKEKDEFYSNPKVTFYRYKNRKYSIFTSGDYDKYVAFKTKKKNKKSLEDTLNKSVTDSEVNQAQYDQGFVPEPVVSEQIKRSIRLQDELREFAQGSKKIVDSLLQSISSESDQKKRRWVQKTVNYYRNILELVKNPLSKYSHREIADQIHEFAFFLATENQYHLLGNRFDEALTIYQKLRREQRHLVEDIEQGLITAEEADIDVLQTKEQMAQDDESVASILLSIARVRLDSGELVKAKDILEQSHSLVVDQSLTRAQIYQIESVIARLEGDIETSFAKIEKAAEFISAIKPQDSVEGLTVLASKADLMQRTGDAEGAKAIYKALIEKECQNEEASEVISSAALNLAILNISEGQIGDADRNVSEALVGLEILYAKEPDRILPTLLTAKYIKGLVLMHQGELEASVAILEKASAMVPEKRSDLQVICAPELLEVFVSLHDLYRAIGNNDDAEEVAFKAKALLALPTLVIPEEQREAIELSLI
ncbi:MAG: hypothetical protein J6W82_09530 [Bacteroidales bacterium]|nr:hypothetical protein [Bacteroidales bacterium]